MAPYQVHEYFSISSGSYRIGLILITLLACINFLYTPLGVDQKVSIAYSQQAELKGSFPDNLTKAWNLRGLGYNTLTYLIYESAKQICDYERKRIYEVTYKAHILLIYLVIVFFSVYLCKESLINNGLDYINVGLLVLLAFLAQSYWASYQPESVAGMICILGVCVGISNIRYSYILSGAILSLTVTLKGSTGILGPVGILIMAAHDRGFSYGHLRSTISGTISGILIVIVTYIWFPVAIQDMIDATLFQSTTNISLDDRLLDVSKILVHFFHIPFLGLLFILVPFLIAKLIRLRRLKMILVVVFTNLLPFLTIFIQGKGFAYHFSILLPSTLFLTIYVFSEFTWGSNFGIYCVFIFMVIYTFSITPLSIGNMITYSKSPSPNAAIERFNKNIMVYNNIVEKYNIKNDDEVLYLTDGRPTYYIGATSALRYHYPLPLQRKGAEGSEIYYTTYKRALQSEPDYILHGSEWFNLDRLPKLKSKIDSEYLKTDELYASPRTVDFYIKNR